MRKSRHHHGPALGLDSLVDIVSNTVGILLILAVFMALLAQLDLPGSESREEPRTPVERPAQRLLVPWAHATAKNAAFFQIRGNKVLPIDMTAFYRALAEQDPSTGRLPMRIDIPGVEARYFPVTNYVYCLEFRPSADAGETPLGMREPASAWQQALARHPGERFFYFFWVTGDSFELFREVRESLWERDIEVGWKPVPENAPLEICNGFDDSRSFQPQ